MKVTIYHISTPHPMVEIALNKQLTILPNLNSNTYSTLTIQIIPLAILATTPANPRNFSPLITRLRKLLPQSCRRTPTTISPLKINFHATPLAHPYSRRSWPGYYSSDLEGPSSRDHARAKRDNDSVSADPLSANPGNFGGSAAESGFIQCWVIT